MKEILEKISAYNIFTNLIPGVIFCYLAEIIYGYPLLQKDPIIGLFLYYFAGLVISRIGSNIIEPILIGIGIVHYSKHTDFIEASKADPKIEELLVSNNLYRSSISLSISLLLVGVFSTVSRVFWMVSTCNFTCFLNRTFNPNACCIQETDYSHSNAC
jgi:hypothetical protein